ncbi:6-carboxyhexanoate--CoA ligase [uncultured Veillonella sp.]|uniref:6-carboxyhexanoate--CoA ligase n=1 Tax=uncultured Veillonella sp. TaxID=159268 RepID=UPI002593B483|nr:6-carboxyhexanoate--CoA ligase [uncultured Veillonella sp.]
MLYSIRMRAAEGGPHEQGGHHISGAERLVTKEELEQISSELVHRALTHSKGCADFIRITIDAIPDEAIHRIPCLTIADEQTDGHTGEVPTTNHEAVAQPTDGKTAVPATDGKVAAQPTDGKTAVPTTNHETDAPTTNHEATTPPLPLSSHRQAEALLTTHTAITPVAFRRAVSQLLSLPESMRGAMLVDMRTGQRLDPWGQRGVRVSRMSFADETAAITALNAAGYSGVHLEEALVLASKVLSAPGVVGELCISDDPDYTTGYVSYGNTYHRLHHMKPVGSPLGGRLFFVDATADIAAIKNYLETTVTLVNPPTVSLQGENHETL